MVVDAADGQLRVEREDRSRECDAIAELPVKAPHQLRTDQAAAPVGFESSHLFRIDLVLAEDGLHLLRIDREIGEEVLPLLVVRPDPLHLAGVQDTGELPDLLLV